MKGEQGERTVELTQSDVLRLATPTGIFWNGCQCVGCTALRIKLAAAGIHNYGNARSGRKRVV